MSNFRKSRDQAMLSRYGSGNRIFVLADFSTAVLPKGKHYSCFVPMPGMESHFDIAVRATKIQQFQRSAFTPKQNPDGSDAIFSTQNRSVPYNPNENIVVVEHDGEQPLMTFPNTQSDLI